MIENPLPSDVLPRKTLFNEPAEKLAEEMLPWVERNPRFTLLCALQVAGMVLPEDAVKHRHLSSKVHDALLILRCVPDGETEMGFRIWHYPGKYKPPPPIVPLQVEVARAWLREHTRETTGIRRKFTSDAFRRLATNWTRTTKKFTERQQLNVHTGERYHSDSVYIANDAFIAAAIAEGFHCQRMPGSRDCWFNFIHRATGVAWRGAAPSPWRQGAPAERRPSVARARKSVERFLRRAPRYFKLKDAPQVAKLRRYLRALGYSHRVMLIDGERGSMWFKIADMPRWEEPTPVRRRPPAPLALDLAGKTSVSLQEAAGRTIRGRPPRALVLALRSQGFIHKGRRWVKMPRDEDDTKQPYPIPVPRTGHYR